VPPPSSQHGESRNDRPAPEDSRSRQETKQSDQVSDKRPSDNQPVQPSRQVEREQPAQVYPRGSVEIPKEDPQQSKTAPLPAGGFGASGSMNRASISDHEVKNILGQVSIEPASGTGKGQGAQAEAGLSNFHQKVAASAPEGGQKGEQQRLQDQVKELRDLQQKDLLPKDIQQKDAQLKDLAQRQLDRALQEQVIGAIRPELAQKLGDLAGQKADAHGFRYDGEKGHDAAAKSLGLIGQPGQGMQAADAGNRPNIPGKEIQAGKDQIKDIDHNIRPEITGKTSTIKTSSNQNIEDFGIQPFILPPRAIHPGTPSGGSSMVDVRVDATTKSHNTSGQDFTGDRRIRIPVREGETLEQIAERRFGDSRFVGLLATINPTGVKMITEGNRQVAVIVGNEIILPSRAELELYVKTSIGRKPQDSTEVASGPLAANGKVGEFKPSDVKAMIEKDNASKGIAGGQTPRRVVGAESKADESKTALGKAESTDQKNEQHLRTGAGKDPLISDWMQVRYINSTCRIVVADPGPHATVFSIKLQLRVDNRWLNIATYEFSRARVGATLPASNGHSVRYLYFRDGSRRAFQLDLPETTIREMALEDFSKHWHAYQKAYLLDDTKYL
jgi:hypothetical protein